MKIAALWLALMLVYLLGDVLRIFSGGFVPVEIGGKAIPPIAWLGAAIMMLIPIVMMLVNVFLADKKIVYANIIATSALFLFNAAGLPSYKSLYDIFLIVAGLIINVVRECPKVIYENIIRRPRYSASPLQGGRAPKNQCLIDNGGFIILLYGGQYLRRITPVGKADQPCAALLRGRCSVTFFSSDAAGYTAVTRAYTEFGSLR